MIQLVSGQLAIAAELLIAALDITHEQLALFLCVHDKSNKNLVNVVSNCKAVKSDTLIVQKCAHFKNKNKWQ